MSNNGLSEKQLGQVRPSTIDYWKHSFPFVWFGGHWWEQKKSFVVFVVLAGLDAWVVVQL